MSDEVLSAVVAATASLVVAVISILASTRTNRRVTGLTKDLEQQKLRLAGELEERRRRVALPDLTASSWPS